MRSSPGAGRSPNPGWRAAPSSAPSRCRRHARSTGCCAIRERGGSPGGGSRQLLDPGADRHAADYRGEPTVDGGLLEPIPYRTALREGATHVLVLRSRDAALPRTQAGQARRAHARARRIPSSCRCCAAAATLQPRRGRARALGAILRSPAPATGRGPAGQPPGPPVQHRSDRIIDSVRLGADTMASGSTARAPPVPAASRPPAAHTAPGGLKLIAGPLKHRPPSADIRGRAVPTQ